MSLTPFFYEQLKSNKSDRSFRKLPDDFDSWQEGVFPKIEIGVERLNKALYLQRLYFTFLIILLVISLLLAKLFSLQIALGNENFSLSEGNRTRIKRLLPERGLIMDHSKEILATNRPAFRIILDLSRFKEDSTEAMLAVYKDEVFLNKEELLRLVKEGRDKGLKEITLREGLDRDTVLSFETKSDPSGSLSSDTIPIREYLFGEEFAHVLGYTGEINEEELIDVNSAEYAVGDRIGKLGLEKVYDKFLKGVAGKKVIETDAMGKDIREVANEKPIPGYNIYLNIDSRLQIAAYESLKEQLLRTKATGGAVIVEEVNTGKILALVVLPTFEPNLFSKPLSSKDYESVLEKSDQPFFNRAIAATYPPGSTFKLVTATAVLEEGIVSKDTKIEEVQTITVGGYNYSNWTLLWGVAPHGELTIVKALAQSSDIYFYEVGGGYGDLKGLGEEKLSKWAREFGFSYKTGIDLVGEVPGLVPDAEYKLREKGEPWYLGDTYITAIGQGFLLATPIQVVNMTSTVANGGKVLRPYLVDKIQTADGLLKEELKPMVLGNIASSGTFALIRQGMKEAVEYGTAVELKNFKIPIAGKTGTTETGSLLKQHAWFTSFAPAEAPEIAVTVFVENGGQGSQTALPVARKVYDRYFQGRN